MTAQETSLANAFETQLSSNVTDSDTVFPVNSIGSLTSPCYLVVDPDNPTKREYILFDGTFTASEFTVSALSKRGLAGSASGAQSHTKGAKVRAVAMQQHFEDLNDRVDLSAVDSEVVHLAGAETITGAKTFSVDPTLADGSSAVSATEADARFPQKAAAETISGAWTYSTDPTLADGSSALSLTEGNAAYLVRDGDLIVDPTAAAYGVTGDGTDETTKMQAAIDAAIASRAKLWLPPGLTVFATSLDIQHGLHISGYGATIKQVTGVPNSTRLLTNQNNAPVSATTDTAPLVIEGVTLDGNRANQGTYTGFELEQNALLFIQGNNTNTGRVVAIVRDVTFNESVGDGLHGRQNTDITVENCRGYNCFRGGLTFTGGYSRVTIDGYVGEGDVHTAYVQEEVDATGYGTSYRVDFTADNLDIEGATAAGLELETRDGGIIRVSNSRVVGGFYLHNTVASPGTATFDNCYLSMTNGTSFKNWIYRPKDVTFRRCQLVLVNSKAAGSTYGVLEIFLNVGGTVVTEGRCRFLDGCSVTVTGNDATDTVYGLRWGGDTGVDALADNNMMIIRDAEFGSGLTYGAALRTGGNLVVDGIVSAATYAIYLNGTDTGGRNFYASVGNVEIIGSGGYMNIATGSSANTVRHRGTTLSDAENVLRAQGGLAVNLNTFQGGRVIVGSNDPTATATPGYKGDRYRTTNPAASSVVEWVCVDTGTTSTSLGTWKTAITAGA